MLRGRSFTAAESTAESKSSVAVIDQLAAEKLWPAGDAVGKHIRLDGSHQPSADVEVVGVVGNIRDTIVGGKPEPHLYIPFGQDYQANVQFHLKVAGGGPEAADDLSLLARLREAAEQARMRGAGHDLDRDVRQARCAREVGQLAGHGLR